MAMEWQRELSLLLFNSIRSTCVDLSKETLKTGTSFNSRSVSDLLQNLGKQLKVHYEDNKDKGYMLSDKLADYIFVPITGLLKQDSLDDSVVSLVLYILGFLLDHCWRYSPSKNALQDQLFPLILYLAEEKNGEKSFDFRANAVYCLGTFLDTLPGDYFKEDSRRLALLGNTVTYLLETLSKLVGPVTQEEIELVQSILNVIQRLFAWKITPDQLSMILPGTVSKLVNFTIASKSLHFSVIISVVRVLKELIVKVFTIGNLEVEIEPSPGSLNDLWENFVKNDDTSELEEQSNKSDAFIMTHIVKSEGPRTDKWLRATSQQLKLSLVAFFKYLMSSPTSKRRLETKPQIVDEIISFVEQVVSSCFLSLFNDIFPLLIDITSLLLDSTNFTNDQEEKSRFLEYSEVLLQPQNRKYNKVVFDLLDLKLKDMINLKLQRILLLADDDRVKAFFVGLKFQLILYQRASKSLALGLSEVEMVTTIIQLLQLSVFECVATSTAPKVKTNDLMKSLTNVSDSSNKLDSVELPSYVNASKLVKINKKENKRISKLEYVSNLMILSKKWEKDIVAQDSNINMRLFEKCFTASTENSIGSFLRFAANTIGDAKSLDMLESLIENPYSDLKNSSSSSLASSVSLWIANTFLNSLPENSSLDYNVDDFLYFDDDEVLTSLVEQLDDRLNLSYFVMYKSQDLIDKVSDFIRMPESVGNLKGNEYQILEISYATALDSIGIISKQISHEDFQVDFLMNYLYPLLEALTFQQNPLIQSHAARSVTEIINTHYGGSFRKMIETNQDYIIDALNLKLNVTSELTPSLPGILLIIIKICGPQLFSNNQLVDILSQMFVLIDNYHGYSFLVEGFFVVFNELVGQISQEYNYEPTSIENSKNENHSRYKPWGMTNVEQLLRLLDDSQKLVDPFGDYDPNKEYFKRKHDLPFDKQADSDDEIDSDDDDDGSENEDSLDKWECRIPKQVYMTIQRIFTYGLRLLNHHSISLKVQILKTLTGCYPILCQNYSLLLPILADNWPNLLVLIAGSTTLSEFQQNQVEELSYEAIMLITPALDFVIQIIKQDKTDGFLSGRFLESWSFLSTHSLYFREKPIQKHQQTENSVSVQKMDPRMRHLYREFLVTGLIVYEGRLPDLKVAEILTKVQQLGGIPKDLDDLLTRDIRNVMWVLANTDRGYF